ncbi:MAG TPA: hypothetical protein ENI11_00840 [Actinobacteria bacterium]|nr:hypothetical protein [Actinomycetota bacterium]
MTEEKNMVYQEALPFLLKRNGWSYRELDYKTRKSASYWNQTVRREKAAPQTAATYEMLAEVFSVEPEFFREYCPIKASEMVLRDPKLAYKVVQEVRKSGKKK